MTDQHNINLLVLPELFPEFEGDWKGVFIEDYLSSVEHLEPQTLYVRLTGKQQGVVDEKFWKRFKLRRVTIGTKNVGLLLKPFMYFLWFKKGVKYGLAYSEANIIHAHGAILNGTLAYLIAKKRNIPFIVTEHTGPYSRILNSWIKRKISKFIFNKAAKVLVVSEHQKNEVLKLGIVSDKVQVSYNPVNTKVFKTAAVALTRNIVFVSRLDEFKGGLRTLKAFSKICQTYPDFSLTIIGEGEEYGAIKDYVARNSLQDRVELKGTLTKLQIAEVYASSSFMVFPSRFETFGLVVAEALSSGLPVIATNRTAPKEFVNEKNGILVDPDNIEEIAVAMEKMIANRSTFKSAEISHEMKARFGLENFGIYLSGVYQKVVACVE